MQRFLHNQDFLSGLLLLVLGGAFAWLGRGLKFGTLSTMGSGFVPWLLSAALMLIGAYFLLRSLRVREAPDRWPLARVTFVICTAPLCFGVLVHTAGLALTAVITALYSRLAMRERLDWRDVITAVALSAFCCVAFVVLLGQALPLWPDYD